MSPPSLPIGVDVSVIRAVAHKLEGEADAPRYFASPRRRAAR